MEIVLNFEEKELAVNEDCNFLDLHKKLKKLLGEDLRNWTIAGKEVKWLYQYWPTIIYQEPYKLTWHTAEMGGFTYGPGTYTDSVVCFSDNEEHVES
jgi:hypothetical protein